MQLFGRVEVNCTMLYSVATILKALRNKNNDVE